MSQPRLVKYCPLCSAPNDPAEPFCTQCHDGELMGVPPEPQRTGPDTGHLDRNGNGLEGQISLAPPSPATETEPAPSEPVPAAGETTPGREAPAEPSPGTRRVEQAARQLTLELIERPGVRFAVLDGQSVGASREAQADVTLRGVPDLEYISSVHARFFTRGTQWYVQHLGHTNFIKVDGMKFEKREEVPLSEGSVLVLSKTAFHVVLTGGA